MLCGYGWFELDFNVKFSLLCLLQFLSDLKSTVPNIPYLTNNLYAKR